MAYADQSMSTRRYVAIVIVVALHIALGYAFATGLAYNVVKNVARDLKTFDVTEETPPPEEAPPPPPPPEQNVQPPPVVAPPPIVAPVVQSPPTIQAVVAPRPVITETAPPAPPPPPKPALAKRAEPRGNPGSWASTDDYPSASLRAGEQGVTAFTVQIGPDGKPTACSVTSSSGSAALDDQTCKLVMRRARFKPAVDGDGQPTNDKYNSRIRWQIPD